MARSSSSPTVRAAKLSSTTASASSSSNPYRRPLDRRRPPMTIEPSIIDAAARLRRNGESHLVATVVRVSGSVYRRPGSRLLLTQFRWITGSASGGCFDGDIASKGWFRTRDGEPVIVTYDSHLPEGTNDD